MRTKVYFPMICAAALAVLGVLVWRDLSAAREAERSRNAILARVTEAVRGRRQAEGQLAAAGETRDRAQAALDVSKKMPVAAAKIPATPVRQQGSILAVIRNEPDAEAFYIASQRADLAARYGPLIRALKLTPEAAAKFQDAFIRKEEDQMDLAALLRMPGGETNGKALMEFQAKSQANYEASQRAVLGDAGYRQLEEYERTSSTRGMVSAIAGVAAVERAPFTPQQADALVQAIAGASENYRKGYQANHNDVDWSAVEAQARTILSPQQFTIFTTMDPGPSRAGLLQTRMYALVARAAKAEAEKNNAAASKTPGR
ncbi:MAG: hypothetical protein H7343_06735 [Undibacterium sp.]|nr:hypothetical protein [Opitutaceae bacterium]